VFFQYSENSNSNFNPFSKEKFSSSGQLHYLPRQEKINFQENSCLEFPFSKLDCKKNTLLGPTQIKLILNWRDFGAKCVHFGPFNLGIQDGTSKKYS